MPDTPEPSDHPEQAPPDATNTAKKDYHRPQFTSLGTVEQLTLGGASGTGEELGASLD
jgi:hypothetical protein